jgi:transcriptional regulator with XRE-family HTH domain
MIDRGELGRLVQARRLELGLSLRQLGKLARVSHATIDWIEGGLDGGKRDVGLRLLEQVLDALGLALTIGRPGSSAQPDMSPVIASPRKGSIEKLVRVLVRIDQDEFNHLMHEVPLWEKRFPPDETL